MQKTEIKSFHLRQKHPSSAQFRAAIWWNKRSEQFEYAFWQYGTTPFPLYEGYAFVVAELTGLTVKEAREKMTTVKANKQAIIKAINSGDDPAPVLHEMGLIF